MSNPKLKEWQSKIQEWQKSELTQTEWCRQNQFPITDFFIGAKEFVILSQCYSGTDCYNPKY